MRDIKNNIDVATSLNPEGRASSANGASVDLRGFEAAVVCAVVGAITDGTHALKVQESDDGSSFTDVSAGDLEGSFSNLATYVNQRVGYKGSKRYIRVVVTVSGATTGGVYAAMVVRGMAHVNPVE